MSLGSNVHSGVSVDNDGHSDKYLLYQLQDLMLTFPTLLIIQSRKEEALYYLERCILICEKYRFLQTKAILTLMIASIYLNDKHREYADVWDTAHEALNLFSTLSFNQGVAETYFLIGMIFEKKLERNVKTDSLKLKRMPKSENIGFNKMPKIQKSSSAMHKISYDETIEERERKDFEMARQKFIELKHEYGIARVSLAIGICRLHKGPESEK